MKWPCAAAAAFALLLLQAAARTPSIDEQFSMHSVEIDDTENGTIVLKQFLAIDPEIKRSIMVADGPLLGPSGHLEQIIRCDGKTSTETGYFIDIEGSGAAQQCANMSRTCSPFSQFWDFPANISDLGLSPLPGPKQPPRARFDQLYNKFEYWIEGERYELYTSNSSGSSSSSSSGAAAAAAGGGGGDGDALTDVPVWMGKVFGRHHMWHFEYSKFAAGEPPESIFEPPPGIVCQPSRRFSVTSAVDDVSVGTPLRTPVLSERAPHDDVASSGLVFANDPYLADMSHYEPDCRIDPMAPSGMVCSQRAAPSTALRVACVGDSITAVGHTSSKAHQYPSQLQDILDASYGNGTYSVTNLGTCGTTLSKTGASPYWNSATYQALISNEWDVVVVMLGTNDARDAGSGGPEHWPREHCDHATAETLPACPFAQDYAALVQEIATLGRNATLSNGSAVKSIPDIYIMVPPPLMKQGAYDMNQTIINTVLPQLIPLIGDANSDVVKGVIDVYHGMGGVTAPGWETAIPAEGCTLNSTFAPCAWYCDAQSCAPGQCHPNDAGCAHLAEVVKDGWLGNGTSTTTSGTPEGMLSPQAPSPSPITVPHLSGIFMSLDSSTASWTVEEWVNDLQAMQNIGIEWFCIRAVVAGASSGNATLSCPLGQFASFFPYDAGASSECFSRVNSTVDTISNVLSAAKQVGLGVHLGLGYPSTSKIPEFLNSSTYYADLAWMNWEIAQSVWSLYAEEYGEVIQGWYTDVEESNVIGELQAMPDLVGHYLEPLARDLHENLTSGDDNVTRPVWASPYYVYNLTRHPAESIMTTRFYADWWGQVFVEAPHLDFIAPQDSMGAQGNSFANVSDMLTEFGVTAKLANRKLLSNVELFEVWPLDCQWTPETGICHGRHPAPFDRIKAQMANEAPFVDELIAWEWHSCLSPNSANSNWTSPVYEQYKAYVGR